MKISGLMPGSGHLLNRTAAVGLFVILFASTALLSQLRPASIQPSQPDTSAYAWLYRRERSEPVRETGVVELLVVGDVMSGRGVAEEDDVFRSVAPWMAAADLTMGNLEGGIALAQASYQKIANEAATSPYRLDAPPAAVSWLQAAGFDLLSLANNHTLDMGSAGLESTANRLRSAGIRTPGVGRSPAEAYQPVIINRQGLRIAFLAFNLVPGYALNQQSDPGGWIAAGSQPDRMIAAVQFARSQADVVVVSVHWGEEYSLIVNPGQRELASELFASGADLVVGHHPHTIQGTQVFEREGKTGFVAYSLGNFLFDQQDERAQAGLALRCLLDRQGLRGVQALPVKPGPHPRWMTPEEAAAMGEHIRPDPRWVGFSCRQFPCQQVEPGMESSQAIFWSGEIDLTGDGIAETVRRVNERVTVYHGKEAAWQSPDNWQVVDLALGDPNDDGRYELMLAINKPDESGLITSHPFIIGYRSGVYRQLWGGSAVADSIREVELGDLDGDGVQELVALEDAAGEQKRVITVWRWHGWGFQLLWRSEPAWFRDMTLVRNSLDSPYTIRTALDW